MSVEGTEQQQNNDQAHAAAQMDKMLDASMAQKNDSQFQKPSDLVERDEDTGLVSVESLCMNCGENVSLSRAYHTNERGLTICRERLDFC